MQRKVVPGGSRSLNAIRRWRGALAAVLAVAGASHAQAADEVADFYRGKTITMIVGGNAGGGYDVYARAIAPRLSGYIPGKPSIVIVNSPGAGSLIAARTLYFNSAKDGTVIGEIFRGAIVEPLIGNADAARYDSRKFHYLASAATADGGTCFVRPDAKVQSFQQALEQPLIVGAAGRGAAIGDMPVLLQRLLKTKFKIVAGYKGSPDTLQAFERGEIEAVCGLQYAEMLMQVPGWLKDGQAKVIVQLGMRPNEDMTRQGIPTIWDFIKTPDDRETLELIFGQLEFGRPFLAPPGVPLDRVAALRKAFDDTFKDAGFRADAEKMKLELDPRSGEDLQELVDKFFATRPDLVARAREVVK
ncbi:MAG: efflux transporter protein [Hyphomicrobiales bacterium]|nr:efflux transporter protein [Hyphomicrobiales bacterium]